MKKYILLPILFITYCAIAQQQIMYTQYMWNPLALNPAVAGSGEGEAVSLTGIIREQWAGVEGAPSTKSLTAHMPVTGKNVGLGLTFFNDKLGVTNESGIYGAYAYKIKLGQRKYSGKQDKFTLPATLSFGLSAGVNNYSNRLSDAFTGAGASGSDPGFAQNITSAWLFNFGLGVYYRWDAFHLGLSAPNFITNEYDRDGAFISKQARHFYLSTGTTYVLSKHVKLQPNVLVKAVSGAPVEFDLNTNVVYNDVVWVGVQYRSLESLDFLLGLQITEELMFGYSFDLITNDLKQATSGSHEFMLKYNINAKSKAVYVNPRFF